MKPVHIGVLVLIGAMGGALIMRLSQRQAPGVVPAPIVTPAPVVTPPPAVPPPPAVTTPTAVEVTAAPEPKPSPVPKKAAITRVHHAKPARAAVATIAQKLPPAREVNVPEPGVSQQSAPEQSAPEKIQDPPAAPAEVTPPAAPEQAPAPVPQPAPSVTLRAGMLLPVRLGESLSSEHNQVGDTFTATLDAPLVVDDFVIAERGARVEGRVVEAQKASHLKGQSILSLELTRLNTTDGQHVGIETDPFRKQADTSTDRNVGIVATAAGVGAVIGAMAGGGKGAGIGAAAGGAAGTGGVIATRAKPAALPSETKISFRLRQTVTITEQMNR